MAITKEMLGELLKEYKGPDDFYDPEGLIKQLSKALIERAMQAELTEQLGYEKNEPGEKQTENRRYGEQAALYPIREAWELYPPVTVPASGDHPPEMPEAADIVRAMEAELRKQ
jgi:hypothetical protein